jgi:hypothetical protein
VDRSGCGEHDILPATTPSSEAERARMDVWPRDPDADMCPREASGMSTDDCMDHQVQRSAIGEACRFVAPRRTINHGRQP